MSRAVELYGRGVRAQEVEFEVQSQGASEAEARQICEEAAAHAEAHAVQNVALPASARLPVNYYFALGVTPRATTDRIREAYRSRAREIHPDRHNGELNRARWTMMMSTLSDAANVLSDSELRRAYDVFWLRRSRSITAANATRSERRGDWECRYLWYLAEAAEHELRLGALLCRIEDLVALTGSSDGAASELTELVDEYEDRVLRVRTQTYTVPPPYDRLADGVRGEMHRKDRLIRVLRSLEPVRSGALGEIMRQAQLQLTEVIGGQRAFELQRMREAIAA